MDHLWPFGGTRRHSMETLDRWIRALQAHGFDALEPNERIAGPVTDAGILLLAESLKREKPNRAAAHMFITRIRLHDLKAARAARVSTAF